MRNRRSSRTRRARLRRATSREAGTPTRHQASYRETEICKSTRDRSCGDERKRTDERAAKRKENAVEETSGMARGVLQPRRFAASDLPSRLPAVERECMLQTNAFPPRLVDNLTQQDKDMILAERLRHPSPYESDLLDLAINRHHYRKHQDSRLTFTPLTTPLPGSVEGDHRHLDQ